jgi:predicted lipid-binding transport protein (Tim44 family)
VRLRFANRRFGALRRGATHAAHCIAGALAILLAVATPALARGGSGSSGFRGGGGGFGGGRGGLGRAFGHGHFFFVPIGGGGGFLVLLLIAVIVFWLLPRLITWWRGQQTRGTAARRRVAQRERRTELAAAEASEEDAAFAPDVVRPAARRLFIDIQSAWSDGDRARLKALVAPDLFAEWERRLDDFDRKGWHNRVKPVGDPHVVYVGLRNAADKRNDRVVVRIDAKLRDYVEDGYGQRIGRADSLSDTTKVREFWVLAKGSSGNWVLQSIEQGAEGEHLLGEDLLASPWSNDRAMRDESLLEGAVADAVPEGTDISELVDLDFQGDARAAALDLSLADGRFAPDVLEVAARRAVDAWSEAVDGDDSALLAIAHEQAAQQLLHPGDPSGKTRLVVRGPHILQIRITRLDAAAKPPTMSIEVDIEGKRYLEDRDTAAVVAGIQSRSSSFTEHWTLALDGNAAQPWRIAEVATPIGRR